MLKYILIFILMVSPVVGNADDFTLIVKKETIKRIVSENDNPVLHIYYANEGDKYKNFYMAIDAAVYQSVVNNFFRDLDKQKHLHIVIKTKPDKSMEEKVCAPIRIGRKVAIYSVE